MKLWPSSSSCPTLIPAIEKITFLPLSFEDSCMQTNNGSRCRQWPTVASSCALSVAWSRTKLNRSKHNKTDKDSLYDHGTARELRERSSCAPSGDTSNQFTSLELVLQRGIIRGDLSISTCVREKEMPPFLRERGEKKPTKTQRLSRKNVKWTAESWFPPLTRELQPMKKSNLPDNANVYSVKAVRKNDLPWYDRRKNL